MFQEDRSKGHLKGGQSEAARTQTEVTADGGEERSGVSRHAPQADQSAADRDSGAGASPGNTHLLSSQGDDLPLFDTPLCEQALTSEDGYSGPLSVTDLYPSAVLAYDWLELGGLARWDQDNKTLMQLERIHEQAVELKEPLPYVLAGQELLVLPRGMGSGRQERLSIVLEWQGGRMLGYLGRSLLIGIIVVLAVAAASIPLMMLMAVMPGVVQSFLPFAMVALGSVIIFRLGVMLPAGTIDRKLTLRQAWQATSGQTDTILVLALVAAGAAVVVQIPTLVSGDPGSLISLVYSIAVNWFVTMIGVSMLTTLYGHFVEGRAID